MAQLVRGGLEAAPDLSAVDGPGVNTEPRSALMLHQVRLMLAVADSPEAAEAEVSAGGAGLTGTERRGY